MCGAAQAAHGPPHEGASLQSEAVIISVSLRGCHFQSWLFEVVYKPGGPS